MLLVHIVGVIIIPTVVALLFPRFTKPESWVTSEAFKTSIAIAFVPICYDVAQMLQKISEIALR